MIKRVVAALAALMLLLPLGCSNSGKVEEETDNILENTRYTDEDVEIFNKTVAAVKQYRDAPMNELVMHIAKSFLGTPYVAGTLDKEDPEMLTINLRQTDCILFVEMCLSIALTVKSDDLSFENYCRNVRALRYDKGIVDGYASRNHYTSAWIIQGEERGIFREISKELGGSPLAQKFNFMSTHPDSYRQLKADPSLIEGIRKSEEYLNGFSYWYLPKEQLSELTKGIKDGDIICYNSSVEGLDIAHVAYAYWQDGELNFIHASYGDKKVEINPTPLIPYTNSIKGHNGLRVVRLNR